MAGGTLSVSFDADEQVTNIQNDITGAESHTLTEADFTETDNGDGTYTYDGSQAVTTDGRYDSTLTTAADAAGNNGGGSSVTDFINLGTVEIDDFEAADLSAWGSPTAFTLSSSVPVHSGTQAIVATGTNLSGWANMAADDSALNTQPQPGDTFRYSVQLREASNNGVQLWYGAQATGKGIDPERYFAFIDADDNQFELFYRNSSGTNTQLGTSQAVTWTSYTGQYVDVEITWGSGGSHTARVLDSSSTELASITASDSTLTSGAVGMQVNVANVSAGSETIVDDLRVVNT